MYSTSVQDSLDFILMTKEREQTLYLQSKFYKPPLTLDAETHSEQICILDDTHNSRQKICYWTFNVIDHFDLSRTTAVISMDIFDRFLATRGNRCTPDFALLAAITTLYISLKIHEQTKISSESLCNLSRGRFSPTEIEEMEIEILKDLSWLVHPPVVTDFLCPLLRLLPGEVSNTTRNDLFENARYLAELAVFDLYLIKYHASTIASAIILNLLDNEVKLGHISFSCLETFCLLLDDHNIEFLSNSEELRNIGEALYQTVCQSQDSECDDDQYREDERKINSSSPISAICKNFS